MNMTTASTNIQEPGRLLSLASMNQTLTTDSRIAIVLPSTQGQSMAAFAFGILAHAAIAPMEYDPDLSKPRLPGSGKNRILWIAPDFDAPLEW